MDLEGKLQQVKERYEEITQAMADPAIYDRPQEYAELTKEHTQLKELVEDFDEWQSITKQISGNEELMEMDDDPEITEMARVETKELKQRLEELEEEIKMKLIPKDPDDSKNCIIEVRAGTGGDEAALFAGDLFDMYRRYADSQKWKQSILSVADSEKGGFKEIVFELSGEEVYGKMKYESGVHRVQRVPETESQGRVHTSAATVAVLPEVNDDVEINIDMNEVRVDTFRASGAGGQHVNKTDSAIRLTHEPSGVVVECQQERSQHQNKEKALVMLKTKLYDMEMEKIRAERAADRKSQVSTGDRSAKIRTYNFPQGRLTDHRINLTLYNLDDILKGNIGDVIKALRVEENLEKLNAIMD
ncbi:peptide chain release factor 1 [Rhodohalobacter sulfatireducens]|uniref:Peptide chain release factor 1 n=1 Tax=Rhodohalobacter sulfatireducens TaxID=2911366 RepID=A0ABS9KE03_9BACT|nr:peptide chain release factor 1 [Rhodohalobacter sulfatireducens]MCG2589055.1 peptide chain release factor 1 [Rhodohalobacter sulfatireducens]MDR9367091.1 peptide chain release factor 1 [Balneolaceae bacterium]MDR9410306.1 peptide chain release factor 1 [Balneolaceae bacterium]